MTPSHPGHLLLVGLPGPTLDAATAATLRRVQPGGYILFTRNIRDPRELRTLLDDLRDLSDAPDPILTIDQEGGRVSRLKVVGNESVGATALRTLDDPALVARHGDLTARQLRLFGFNLNFAPVLDLCIDGDESVDNSLRGRCYGVDVPQTLQLAGAFNTALRAGGVASCGKHFPGYTFARADAHHELPTIARSRAELEAQELAPYRALADQLDSVMVCHAHYPCLDAETPLPASLSRNVITTLLRDEIGFQNLVITDDLDMGAILNGYGLEQTLHLAVGAGADMAMICHRVDQLETARRFLEKAPAAHLDRALASVHAARQKLSPSTAFSEETFHHLDREVWNLRVAVMGEESAAQRAPEDGKRSPVEIY